MDRSAIYSVVGRPFFLPVLESSINKILYENKSRIEKADISMKYYLDHIAVSKYILATLPRMLAVGVTNILYDWRALLLLLSKQQGCNRGGRVKSKASNPFGF